MSSNSTTSSRPRKRRNRLLPPKPRKDFPLTPAPNGYWVKKVKGKVHVFGPWGRRVNGKLIRLHDDGVAAAKALYDFQRDDFFEGRIKQVTRPTPVAPQPETDDGAVDLADICNAFLTSKKRKLQAGEIGQRMYDEYRATTDMLIAQFGARRLPEDMHAEDFEKLRCYMTQKWGPMRLANSIVRVRSVFKYAYAAEVIDKPIRCLQAGGESFSVPSAGVMRKHRNTKGKHELAPAECRALIEAAPVQLKAMIYLGINAGFGAHDCALLPISAIDFDARIVDFARSKTGIARRCPLWSETATALRAAIAKRPKPRTKEANGLVFVTSRGRPWLSKGIANPICCAIRKLMRATGLHRPGYGPYTLRRIFRTIADGAKDQPAVDLIMGHSDPSMGARYRQHIADDRLRNVADHVRDWLLETSIKRRPK